MTQLVEELLSDTVAVALPNMGQITLPENAAKEHMCRVLINPKGFVVQQGDHDRDGPDKAVGFAREPVVLAPGERHTAVAEINGMETVAQLNGAAQAGFGAHELLDRSKRRWGLPWRAFRRNFAS